MTRAVRSIWVVSQRNVQILHLCEYYVFWFVTCKKNICDWFVGENLNINTKS